MTKLTATTLVSASPATTAESPPVTATAAPCSLTAAARAVKWMALQSWIKQTGAKTPTPYAGYDPAGAAKARLVNQKLKAKLETEHAAILTPDWQPNTDWWNSLVPED